MTYKRKPIEEHKKAGRPVGAKTQIRITGLRRIAKQLEKITPKAIEVAAGIMQSTTAKESDILKAAIFITDSYVKFTEKAQADEILKYGKDAESDEEVEETPEPTKASVFSMHVVRDDSDDE